MGLLTPAGHADDAAALSIWRFDEAAGSLVDAKGARTLAAVGAPASATGIVGAARAVTQGKSFSSPLADAAAELAFRSGAWTWEGWVWIDGTVVGGNFPFNNLDGTIAAYTGTGGLGFLVGFGAAGLLRYFSTTTGSVTSTGYSWAGLARATWHHVAFRSTPEAGGATATLDFFVNGVRVSRRAGLAVPAMPTAAQLWVIGGEGTSFDNFVGRIDDTRLSSSSRSDSEVFDSYRRGVVGIPPTLPPYNPDRAGDALARLASQLQGKPGVEKLVRAMATEVQLVEEVLNDMRWLRAIDTASGAQLDGIGDLVGLRRASRGDEAYRLGLRAQVLVNVSSATAEDLIAIFTALAGGLAVGFREEYPRAGAVTLRGGPAPAPDVLAAVLRSAREAATSVVLEYSTDADAASLTTESSFAQVSGGTIAGATSIPVDSTASFPASGSLLIARGTAAEETLAYSSKTGSAFTTSAAAQAHAVGDSVALATSAGLGMGDATNPATGGAIAGALK